MDQGHKSHFDRLLHQPTRFAVLAHLVRCGSSAPFVETCTALGIKHAGALSAHARVLENAGYIRIAKKIVGRKPHTSLIMTDMGRRAFGEHKAALDDLTAMEAAG